jgi:hypothetical protein
LSGHPENPCNHDETTLNLYETTLNTSKENNMNESNNVAQQEENNEPFTLPKDYLIELVQVLVMFRTQLEVSGESDEGDCINGTIAKVSSMILQNLITEKEQRESDVDCETT